MSEAGDYENLWKGGSRCGRAEDLFMNPAESTTTVLCAIGKASSPRAAMTTHFSGSDALTEGHNTAVWHRYDCVR